MAYRNRAITVMAITSAIIGLERMVIAFVMPGIQETFKLNYTQVGAIVSVFAFTWAIGNWGMGGLSDRVGRKKVMVPLMIFGGICSWVTGLAWTFAVLLAVRAIMGFAEGGVMPCMGAVVYEESSPEKRGKSMAMLTGMFAFGGAALGPILSSMLFERLGWRPVFYVYAIPAVIMGIVILLLVREPASIASAIKARKEGKRKRVDATAAPQAGFREVLRNRNIRVLTIIWTVQMIFLWIFTTFGVMFLVRVHNLPIPQVGLAMTGFGVAALVGGLFAGYLADRVGRKPVGMIAMTIGGVICFVFASLQPGASLGLIAAVIFFISIAASGSGPVFWTMITESVGFRLAATGLGVTSGVAEVVGGGILPLAGGGIADLLGLRVTLYVMAALLIVGGALCFFLRETLERRPVVGLKVAGVSG
jgi:MFS family permease